MATVPVQALLKLFKAECLLDEPTKVYTLDSLYTTSRPEADTTPDPFINFAEISFQPGTSSQYMPYFKRIFESTRDQEDGTFVYTLASTEEAPDKLFTLESYVNKDYCWNVHVAGDAVQENIRAVGHLRTNLKHTFLRSYAGYFVK